MYYTFDVAFNKLRSEKIISTYDEMIDLIFQRKITICFRIVNCCIGVIYDKDKDLIKKLDHGEIQFKKDGALKALSSIFKDREGKLITRNIDVIDQNTSQGETDVDYKRIYVLKNINFESHPKFVTPHYSYAPQIYELIMGTSHTLNVLLAFDLKRKNRQYALLTDISPEGIQDHTYPLKHGWHILKYTPAPITIKALKQKCNLNTSYTISKNSLLVTQESIYQLITNMKESSKQEPKDKDIARNKACEIARRIYATHPPFITTKNYINGYEFYEGYSPLVISRIKISTICCFMVQRFYSSLPRKTAKTQMIKINTNKNSIFNKLKNRFLT